MSLPNQLHYRLSVMFPPKINPPNPFQLLYLRFLLRLAAKMEQRLQARVLQLRVESRSNHHVTTFTQTAILVQPFLFRRQLLQAAVVQQTANNTREAVVVGSQLVEGSGGKAPDNPAIGRERSEGEKNKTNNRNVVFITREVFAREGEKPGTERVSE